MSSSKALIVSHNHRNESMLSTIYLFICLFIYLYWGSTCGHAQGLLPVLCSKEGLDRFCAGLGIPTSGIVPPCTKDWGGETCLFHPVVPYTHSHTCVYTHTHPHIYCLLHLTDSSFTHYTHAYLRHLHFFFFGFGSYPAVLIWDARIEPPPFCIQGKRCTSMLSLRPQDTCTFTLSHIHLTHIFLSHVLYRTHSHIHKLTLRRLYSHTMCTHIHTHTHMKNTGIHIDTVSLAQRHTPSVCT